MRFQRDWKEEWVDRMGLIVALSGEHRFERLDSLKKDMKQLSEDKVKELKYCFKQRFTPSHSAGDIYEGCETATKSVEMACE